MRITHISIIHRPLDGRIFAKQCRALAAAGHDVHLIVGGAPEDEIDGVHFHTIARTQTVRPPGGSSRGSFAPRYGHSGCACPRSTCTIRI